MKPTRRSTLAALAFSPLGLFGASASAQQRQPSATWPERPVTLVTPFPGGFAPDVIARLLAERLSGSWGQPVVVQNVVGAGGSIAVDRVAKAAPDGYTLVLSGDAAIVVRVSMDPPLPYDPARDLAPITQIGRTPNVLVVHPSLPATTLAELIALARARPGQLTFAHSGPGTSQHLGGEMLRQMAGIDITGVSYAQSAQQQQDTLQGRVTMGFSNVITALPNVRDGRMRAIAVSSANRIPELPDVPTVAEQGFPGFEAVAWFGLFARAGTPQEVIARIRRDTAAALDEPGFRERLTGLGVEVVGSTPEEFAALIGREIPRMAGVLERAGLRAR